MSEANDAIDFRRGLSGEFLRDLKDGRLGDLLACARQRELDVQIREDYVNFYHQGCSVLKLTRHSRLSTYRAEIHVKYVAGLNLPDRQNCGGNYAVFSVADAFIEAYVHGIADILANAGHYVSPESTVEKSLIRASFDASSPVVFIDRQVQVHGTRKRIDMVGVTQPLQGEPRFILAELKEGLDASIQRVIGQITGYYHVLVNEDGTLKDCVHHAYQEVVSQKIQLGLLPSCVAFPEAKACVECVVILCNYPQRSRLLDRLRQEAEHSTIRTRLVLLDEDCFALPPQDQWERL